MRGSSAAHARRPFASSATPACMLPLYLSERAFWMFWLPLVSPKKMPSAMRPAASAPAASSPLARAIAVPRSATSLNGVLDDLRARRRRVHDLEQRHVFVDQRLVGRIEVRRRNGKLVAPPDPLRHHIREVLVRRHHPHPRQIQRLPRPRRQRLLRRDLRAAFGEDGAEGAEGGVVGGLGGRLLSREGSELGGGGLGKKRR